MAVGVHSSMLRDGHWRQIPDPAGESQLDDVTCLHETYCVAGGAHGFYVWNHGTWSAPIVRGNLLNAWVACTSERRCFGTQDNGADMWGYRFDGAASAYFTNDSFGWTTIECQPHSTCISVDLDTVTIGH
jgi:hypothetical protein